MEAGRALDTWIDLNVMGLEVAPDTSGYVWIEGHGWMAPLRYSTDIAAAWLVVEHFKKPLWATSVYQAIDGTYHVSISKWQNECVLGDGPRGDASSNSAPHAICLAAKAVGAQEQ